MLAACTADPVANTPETGPIPVQNPGGGTLAEAIPRTRDRDCSFTVNGSKVKVLDGFEYERLA
jgi:hypothetical protein